MKVLLRAPLSIYSGYGNDGIGMARALTRWGADVYLEPTEVQAPLPQDIAFLLTKRLEAPFDLTILHVQPRELVLSDAAKRSTGMAVGWTMWEWSSFGNLPGRSSLKKNIQNLDAIIGYDEVSTQCFEPYANKGQALLTLQGGYEPERWQYSERDWFGERFGFAMNGVLTERKDPFVAIEAFKQLKEDPEVEFEGAELHLHTLALGLHPGLEQTVPKLRIYHEYWSEEKLQSFYRSQHVLLAPSRGEGKNLPALEMLSTGGSVIATNWGGHRQWLSSDYAYPLNYELKAEKLSKPDVMNARASVEHMKELMLHCYRNRAEVKQKGELAARIIPQMCSWDAVIEKLFLRLRDNVEGGQKLWDAAIRCRQEKRDD